MHCNNGLNNKLVESLVENKVAQETGDLKYLQDSMYDFVSTLKEIVLGEYSPEFFNKYVDEALKLHGSNLEEFLKIPKMGLELRQALNSIDDAIDISNQEFKDNLVLLLDRFQTTLDNMEYEARDPYDTAVELGFTGTKQEWLKHLEGDSAYEIAVKNGYEGTQAEWLLYIRADGFIQSIQQFATNDAETKVQIPDYGTINSLQGYIKEMFENGGIADRFKTLVDLQASPLVDGDYALVADDTVNNNGIYIKEGGDWVKSGYDPLGQAKAYTKAYTDVYPDVATGRDAVEIGEQFSAVSDNGRMLVRYRKDDESSSPEVARMVIAESLLGTSILSFEQGYYQPTSGNKNYSTKAIRTVDLIPARAVTIRLPDDRICRVHLYNKDKVLQTSTENASNHTLLVDGYFSITERHVDQVSEISPEDSQAFIVVDGASDFLAEVEAVSVEIKEVSARMQSLEKILGEFFYDLEFENGTLSLDGTVSTNQTFARIRLRTIEKTKLTGKLWSVTTSPEQECSIFLYDESGEFAGSVGYSDNHKEVQVPGFFKLLVRFKDERRIYPEDNSVTVQSRDFGGSGSDSGSDSGVPNTGLLYGVEISQDFDTGDFT